jgi:hypothetical protein
VCLLLLKFNLAEIKNYYLILGVPRNATGLEVLVSFRNLAKKYHPDVSAEANSVAKFLEIYEAYDILKDAQKRSDYDRLLLSTLDNQASPGNSIYAIYQRSREEAKAKAEYYASHPFSELKDQLKGMVKEAGSFSGGVLFILSTLGLIMMVAFAGVLILLLPLLICLFFPFIPWVGLQVALFILIAVPYWIWLYGFLTSRK